MYLIVHEDGSLQKISDPENHQGIFESVDAGLIDLIDIRDPDNPKQLIGDEWVEVDQANGFGPIDH